MKKFILISALISSLALYGCMQSQQDDLTLDQELELEEQATEDQPLEPITEESQIPAPTDETDQTEDNLVFSSTQFGFSLKLPKSWESFSEDYSFYESTDELNPEKHEIRLTKTTDPELQIGILILNQSDADSLAVLHLSDAPGKLVGQNDQYIFHISTSGSYAGYPGQEDPKFFELAEDSQSIYESFSLLN